MKLVFDLTAKQLQNAKVAMEESTAAYHEVRHAYCFENFKDADGNEILGYCNESGVTCSIWQGSIIGWVRLMNGKSFRNVEATLGGRLLTIIGEREDVTNKVILDKLTRVLGSSWRVLKPVLYEDKHSDKIFWWETPDHYAQWRSDWNEYYNWLKEKIDPDKGIDKFDGRFFHENECLKLLKIGKLNEARQKYPNVADQILSIV